MDDEDDPLRGVRVLVADDDVATREKYGIHLAMSGAFVHCANNGADALTKVGWFRPHVVICDFAVSDMTGLDLLRRLRAIPSEVPALLLLDLDDDAVREVARSTGFAACLQKRFDPAALVRLIDDLVSPSPTTGSS